MDTRGIAEGMTVRGQDGQKLGKVIECAADAFVVEKGLFFPKDYSIRYDQVTDVKGGEVYLNVADFESAKGAATGTEASRGSAEAANEPAIGSAPYAGEPYAGASGAPAQGASAAIGAEARDELRVPLAAEELQAEKKERQAGEVRVRKEVVTENQQVSVPITREEVHVDRVPASGAEQPGDAAFREGTVSVPVREEEVEIRKRPVVKEEVRVSRTRRQEERRADAEVRHEEARIEQDGDLEKKGDIGEPER